MQEFERFSSSGCWEIMSKSAGGDNINSQQGAESVRQGADTTEHLQQAENPC